MHDLPSQALLQQAHARRVSGEELEVLGKHASSRFLSGQSKNLTDSVVETVKSAGLSPEQVKRVVEFANQSAYQEEFRKEGSHKYVEFHGGPANPAEVLRDLNDGGGGTVFDRGMADYRTPPSFTKKASAPRDPQEKTAGADIFDPAEKAFDEMFKVAEETLPYADPYADAIDMKDKLASARDVLMFDLTRLETDFMDIREDLYDQVKQASLQGLSLGHVIQAWAEVTPGEGYVKLAFQSIGPRLAQEGVMSIDELGVSLTKVAHGGMVNHQHPLVQSFAAFCTTIDKLAHTRAAHAKIDDAFGRINGFLTKLSAAQALIPKAWAGAKGLAEAASAPVADVVRSVAGDTAASVAGGVVKKLPHLGVAVAGKEVYDRGIKHGPGRVPVDYVKSQIPGTQEYYQREYALQQKGWG